MEKPDEQNKKESTEDHRETQTRDITHKDMDRVFLQKEDKEILKITLQKRI